VTSFAAVAWNWYASIPAAAVWVVVLVRNRTEDAALRAHFSATVEKGREYEDYRCAVPAMDPFRGVVRLFARAGPRRWEVNG
jgi:protein-S-isoprenylcysteine O-methyltransferase Ste14